MEEPKITPLARRLAEENGIDWRGLKGTGPEGTIVERDILAYLAKLMAGEVDLPPAPPPSPPPPKEEDLKRAEALLKREGVELSELIPQEIRPEKTKEEPPWEVWDLRALEFDWEAPPPESSPKGPKPPEGDRLLGEDLLWEEELETLAKEEALPLEGAKASAGVALGGEPTTPTALRVFRRLVGLSALEEGLSALAETWGVPKTPLPFLLKAAKRALEDLGLPLRPLLGRLEGERVWGLSPSGSFLEWFRENGVPTDEPGLLCFWGSEEVHTGRPSLFLSPEGILALSGLEEEKARALLHRVALYLEKPLLLLA